MNNTNKSLFISLAILTFVALYIGYNFAPWKQNENAIKTALNWCRLNKIPTAATDVEVQIKGSAFTREFIVTFKSDNSTTEQWLNSSPGIKTKIQLPKAGNFRVQPDMKGAQFCEIQVNTTTNTVTIRVYWS